MTPISSRYAPHVLALLLLAAIPIYLNTSTRHYVDDCRDPQTLLDPAAWETSEPLEEQWDRRSTRRIQWSEGRIVLDPETELHVAVLRSFVPQSLYLRPMRFYGFTPETIDVEWVEAGSDPLPIHVLTAINQSPFGFAEYVVVYDSKPQVNPFAYQLKTAIPELLHGRPPVTMLIVYGTVPPGSFSEARQRARSWLLDAWKRYRSVCNDPSESPTAVSMS